MVVRRTARVRYDAGAYQAVSRTRSETSSASISGTIDELHHCHLPFHPTLHPHSWYCTRSTLSLPRCPQTVCNNRRTQRTTPAQTNSHSSQTPFQTQPATRNNPKSTRLRSSTSASSSGTTPPSPPSSPQPPTRKSTSSTPPAKAGRSSRSAARSSSSSAAAAAAHPTRRRPPTAMPS